MSAKTDSTTGSSRAAWTPPKVFCIEVAWDASLKNRSSVATVLQFLEAQADIESIHERAHTPTEFEYLVSKWGQRGYAGYGVGYFPSHGRNGVLSFPHGKSITLEDLGEMLAGRCRSKTIYFGGCSVLNIKADRIEAFRRLTGAKAVVGFRKDVDWYDSAALEVMLFEVLGRRIRSDAAHREILAKAGGLCKSLGLVYHHARSDG